MKWTDDIVDQLRRIMREPAAELSRTQRAAKWWAEFATHCFRELRHDRAGQMAAALSHYTLFSLLPMLVIMLIVLASFVSEAQEERFESMVVNWLLKPIAAEQQGASPGEGPLGGAGDGAASPGTGAEARGSGAGSADPRAERQQFNEARETLRRSIREIIDGLQQVSFGSIGLVGLLVFIYASTELLATIERSFNTIYGVSRSRPFYLRLPLYYTVITLGPVVLIAGQIGQQWFIGQLEQRAWTAWLAGPMTVLSPLLSTWIVLSLLYVLLPNTKVRGRAAIGGGLTAAVLWVITIQALTVYVSQGLIANVYGALALLPLFLLWLWLTWLIILFGLEVTFTLQSMRGRRFKHLRWKQAGELVLDATWLLPLLSEIARGFQAGRAVTAEQLGRSMQLPQRAIRRLIEPLERGEIVRRVGDAGDDKTEAYCLARPSGAITVGEVLRLGETMQPVDIQRRADDPAWRMVRDLHRHWQKQSAGVTLEALLADADGGAESKGPLPGQVRAAAASEASGSA